MNRLLALFLTTLLFLSGCSPANLPQPTASPPNPPTPAAQTATFAPTLHATPTLETPSPSQVNLELLKNFTYTLEDFKTQVTLKDGVFDDGQLQGRLVEHIAVGDLNGNGQKDAALVLAIKSGGTGTFYDLVVVLDLDGTPAQSGFSYIGDRQGINNLEIASGRIVLDYVTQGAGDPLCCASEHRLRSYLLENGALHLASEQVLDSPTAQATPLPDAILIDQPITGGQLTSPLTVRGRVSQVPPEKKLSYSVTDINAVVLTQGEVSLEGEPGGPGTFTFELSPGTVSASLYQLELVDSAGGILRGRSIVLLVAP